MSVQDSAYTERKKYLRRLNIRETNRERLVNQGGGGDIAPTMLKPPQQAASSPGGTTLLRVEGRK